MKALLPIYCRPLGYVILFFSLFIPFLLVIQGAVTDANLLFYKECTKLMMMIGALMIIFALVKNENHETEKIRNQATRQAVFLTVVFLFAGMIYRVAEGNLLAVNSSSFLNFLIINILALEFSLKRSKINKLFNK